MVVTLGMAELLLRRYGNIAFFRPLVASEAPDEDVLTVLERFSLAQRYEEAVGVTVGEAERLISEDRFDTLAERLIERFETLRERYDFVLCEGLADEALARVIDYDLNVEIAKHLSAPVVGVLSARGLDEPHLLETLRLWRLAIAEQGAQALMLVANRCAPELLRPLDGATLERSVGLPVSLLPEEPALDRPSIRQIARDLDAEILVGDDVPLQRLAGRATIGAMQLEHFLSRLQEDDLPIVPADRADLILGAVVANDAADFPAISAVVLSGDLEPPANVLRLLRNAENVAVPLLHLRCDTMEAAMRIRDVASRIDSHSPKKIATALGLFARGIDEATIVSHIARASTDIVTPVMFEHRLFKQAAAQPRTIVLPETEDERILRAADILLRRRAVRIVLLGNAGKIRARSAALGLDLDDARFVDPDDPARKKALATAYYRLRRHKGVTLEAAYDAMSNATLFATMMVAAGECDGMVSGATHTTRETILPALQTIKTAPGFSLVSSCFFMCFDTRVLVYADCAVVPDPDAAQLAEIAIASAETARRFGIEPRIAMLSYSSGDSGVGSDVEKVRVATRIVKTRRSDLIVDGPMQYDAAVDPSVGAKKMPGSPVAGRATVFIFPDLNTGNNTYKAVQRSAGAIAVGPVLQGLAKPVNDLSRGATVADIVNTVAITAVQAQEDAL